MTQNKKENPFLKLTGIRPKGHFSYEVDYEVNLMRGPPYAPIGVSGLLTVSVNFGGHGRRTNHEKIERIHREAIEEIRRSLSPALEHGDVQYRGYSRYFHQTSEP